MEKLEIKNNKLYIEDKEYSMQDIEISIFLKNKVIGKAKLMRLTLFSFIGLFFLNFLISLFTSQISPGLFFLTYYLINSLIILLLIIYPARKIYNKYYTEYVVIDRDGNKIVRFGYSGLRKDLADEIFKNATNKKIVQANLIK